jgi:hypothetical protein
VASAVATLALLAACLTGISAFDGDVGQEFGLIAIDGWMGESMAVLALALIVVAIGSTLRRLPVAGFLGLGAVAAISIFISRAALMADVDSITEYIGSQGDANGIDSAITRAVDGRITRLAAGPNTALLAMAGAATLVAVGWAAFVELDERRRRSAGEPIIDSSQVPHT